MKWMWLSSCLLVVACTDPAFDTSAVEQAVGCDGPESYIDENGEEVICIYTDEPYDPPPDEDEPPWDWCSSFPEMCEGDGDDPPPPPPPDPEGGGGEDELQRRNRLFGRSLGRSRCYLGNAQCAAVVGFNNCEDPKAVLNYLNDNGQLRQEGAPPVRADGVVAAADTTGKGATAVVRLYDGWYAHGDVFAVKALLHEMGHVCEPPPTNVTDTQPFQDAIAACMAQPAVQGCWNADVNGNP